MPKLPRPVSPLPTAALAAVLLAGCGSSYAPLPPGNQPVAPPPPQGAPLQGGWAWTNAARRAGTPRFMPGVLRPIDFNRVKSRMDDTPTSAGCRPISLQNGELVMSACGLLPRLTDSPFATRKMALRSGGNVPAMVDLRAQGLDGPVKSQEMVGVCWAMALSSIMDNALLRQGSNEVVAPLHLVATDAWDSLHSSGTTSAMTTENTWPYDPAKACKLKEKPRDQWCEDAYHVTQGSWRADSSLSAEVEAANARGTHRVTTFEVIEPPSFDAIVDDLATGQEVYGAFRIDDAAWSRPQGGMITDYASEERGPHAVTIVGYRTNGPRGRELLIKNSWGVDWGDGGYAWLTERTLQDHGDDFFAVVVDSKPGGNFNPGTTVIPGLGIPVPFPIPGLPQPGGNNNGGASGCPQGQVRDGVLQTCVNPCPNGSAPMAMICANGGGGGQQPAPQGCPQGQLNDMVTRACVNACANGRAPAAGVCLP
ncbi:MAG: C1 family peptidase [Polyangiaceae bacterium]